ncbi:MAG: ATP-dependent DNA helicase [Candidatus Micrarchaeota archaeon]
MREHQKQMIYDIYSALEQKKHLLAHAPCGLGKTDAALSPAITYAIRNNLDIYFLTPKISQHKIAVEVIKGLKEKYGLDVRASDIIGRKYACVHPALENLDHDTFYQTCEHMRKEKKCDFWTNIKGTTKIEEAKANILFGKILSEYGNAKTHNELIAIAEKANICPYEIMIKLASCSKIIIADYFHILVPQIRATFLAKTKKKMENSIIIIDEAHNIPKRIRDCLSVSFNNRMILRMENEIKFLGGNMKFEKEFVSWAKQELKDNKNNTNNIETNTETLISAERFNSLLAYFNMELSEIIEYFEFAGSEYIEKAKKASKTEKTNRKSALLKFAIFLRGWFEDTQSSIRILRGSGNFFSLSKRFLDPGIITSELNTAHSVILMSATLYPMAMYRDVLGLDEKRTLMKFYQSPFARSNKINIITDGITTKFSRRNVEEFAKIAKVIECAHSLKKRTAVFFPSYNVLNSVLPFIRSNPKFVQNEKMHSRDLHKLAKNFSSNGGMLIAVQGGSLSEGVDFNNGEIKTAILVGVALEELGLEIKCLIDYYQKKFGMGWEYAYLYPAVVRALQSAGRAIRKEEDKAAIIYVDERFNWQNYRKLFPSNEKFIVIKPNELEKYLRAFWEETNLKNRIERSESKERSEFKKHGTHKFFNDDRCDL